MIHLQKLPSPQILQQNQDDWTSSYKEAKAQRADNLDELKVRYRHPEIKEQIVKETFGKCAYCESKITHIYPGDVEHIKPVSKSDDDVYRWENLTLACGECNRRKSDNYDEDIGIINPYEKDPSQHLYAAGPLIFPRPSDLAGAIACELFELNRLRLIERRKERIEQAQRIIDAWASTNNALLKKLRKKQVDELRDGAGEFSFVLRTFVAAAMKAVPKKVAVSEQSPDASTVSP